VLLTWPDQMARYEEQQALHRRHHHHGQHPGNHEVIHRIGAQHGDGVDLLGHLMVPIWAA
jgi:hypothetical protein